jgi:cytidyltransferase-like protein
MLSERLSFAIGAAFGAAGALVAVYLSSHRRLPHRKKRVFVSGCYDLLHSGHVAFFKEAAALGELWVSVGNDTNVTALKAAPMFPEDERVYMVAAVRWVTKAFVAKGMGHDQGPDVSHRAQHVALPMCSLLPRILRASAQPPLSCHRAISTSEPRACVSLSVLARLCAT